MCFSCTPSSEVRNCINYQSLNWFDKFLTAAIDWLSLKKIKVLQLTTLIPYPIYFNAEKTVVNSKKKRSFRPYSLKWKGKMFLCTNSSEKCPISARIQKIIHKSKMYPRCLKRCPDLTSLKNLLRSCTYHYDFIILPHFTSLWKCFYSKWT